MSCSNTRYAKRLYNLSDNVDEDIKISMAVNHFRKQLYCKMGVAYVITYKDSIYCENSRLPKDSSRWMGLNLVEITELPCPYYYVDSLPLGKECPGFPTSYIEIKNRLFVYEGEPSPMTKEMMVILERYNILQRREENEWPDYPINDAARGNDYYFRKGTIHFKLVRTNRATGWYLPPKVK